MSKRNPPDPLARLGERIDQARAQQIRKEPAVGDRGVLQQDVGFGFRIGLELMAAIDVATALGWAIDHWLGTRPWGIIILFFLGIAAGMLNVYRAVSGINAPVGYRYSPSTPGGDLEDEDEN